MIPMKDEIRIVGAGLAGCEAAWQLARRGHDVRCLVMDGSPVARLLDEARSERQASEREQRDVRAPDAAEWAHRARLRIAVVREPQHGSVAEEFVAAWAD